MKIYKIAKSIRLFRGENVSNKGGHYYTTNKEWARQFTQSGLDKEIKTITLPEEVIYRSELLPFATDEKSFEAAKEMSIEKGFRAFWVDEGNGEPNSVYLI